ncbi:hypothetical protein Barb4_04402 [Bacteroidales bacterium Barb4]|nr:hypothetical protein Barb4_04402 [Bacteroidales bacterium Barb4]
MTSDNQAQITRITQTVRIGRINTDKIEKSCYPPNCYKQMM